MSKPTVSICQLLFSGGQRINLNPTDKIVLVGPNNSGKSQTLREIMQFCKKGNSLPSVVLNGVELKRTGTVDELISYFDERADFISGSYRFKQMDLQKKHIQTIWSQPFLPNGLSFAFINNISADERLTICVPQPNIGPDEHKKNPQQVLYDDTGLFERVNALFRLAFQEDLMIDYRAGSKITIHVGSRPHKNIVDRVSDEYVAEVRRNPRLDHQGDGMKSYAGILFETIVDDLDMNLLDEPEAFLHPPQMRKLGETLSSEVRGQLIVSTHSSEILKGFLEGTKGAVRVLRIRREGDVNLISEPKPEVIKELWSRPELRYSNALDGVFHEETIICEDDSDCRLLNAMADHLAVSNSLNLKDTAYVPTGGKHGAKKIAGVLRSIGVPIKAVFDLDFLSESELVRDIVVAFGGEWTKLQPLWKKVDSAVRNGVKTSSKSEIKNDICELLANAGEDDLPKREVVEAMKQNAPWNVIKRQGKNSLPRGDARKDFGELLESLREIGIYLIDKGEIENFCPEIGGHGPRFVNKLLTELSLDDDNLKDLQEFVKIVHTGVHAPLSS